MWPSCSVSWWFWRRLDQVKVKDVLEKVTVWFASRFKINLLFITFFLFCLFRFRRKEKILQRPPPALGLPITDRSVPESEDDSAMDLSPTKLDYYDDMWKLQSTATLLSYLKEGDDGRHAMILDRTIFYPQGGGQPADTGFILISGSDLKFVVQDVRSKDGIVFHYGFVENLGQEFETRLEARMEVTLFVDEPRRKLNSRLHSAGHLLDICLPRIGLDHLEPSKAYHFHDGPWVEYKGTIPQNEMLNKKKDLELEANGLISVGGKVSADILLYDEAARLCGGCLPDYVPKESTPRIVRIGDNPGCPCGGTHVSEISDIGRIKVSQIRSKKGLTKVSYNVES